MCRLHCLYPRGSDPQITGVYSHARPIGLTSTHPWLACKRSRNRNPGRLPFRFDFCIALYYVAISIIVIFCYGSFLDLLLV
jgi:hypothetical protein